MKPELAIFELGPGQADIRRFSTKPKLGIDSLGAIIILLDQRLRRIRKIIARKHRLAFRI